jgi:hypothetical protein
VPYTEAVRLALVEREVNELSERMDTFHKRLGTLEADRLTREAAQAAVLAAQSAEHSAAQATSGRRWRIVTVAATLGGVILGHYLHYFPG